MPTRHVYSKLHALRCCMIRQSINAAYLRSRGVIRAVHHRSMDDYLLCVCGDFYAEFWWGTLFMRRYFGNRKAGMCWGDVAAARGRKWHRFSRLPARKCIFAASHLGQQRPVFRLIFHGNDCTHGWFNFRVVSLGQGSQRNDWCLPAAAPRRESRFAIYLYLLYSTRLDLHLRLHVGGNTIP